MKSYINYFHFFQKKKARIKYIPNSVMALLSKRKKDKGHRQFKSTDSIVALNIIKSARINVNR